MAKSTISEELYHLAWRLFYEVKTVMDLELEYDDQVEVPELPEEFEAGWDIEKHLVVTAEGEAVFQSLDEMDAEVRENFLKADAFLEKLNAPSVPKYKIVETATHNGERLPWLPDRDLVELMIAVDALDLGVEEVASAWGVKESDVVDFYKGGSDSAHTTWMLHIQYDPHQDSDDAGKVANDMIHRLAHVEDRGLTMTELRTETVTDFILGDLKAYNLTVPGDEITQEQFSKVAAQVMQREDILTKWLLRGKA